MSSDDDSDLPAPYFWNKPALPCIDSGSLTEDSDPPASTIARKIGGSTTRKTFSFDANNRKTKKHGISKSYSAAPAKRRTQSQTISDSDEESSGERWHSVQRHSQDSTRGSQSKGTAQSSRTSKKWEMTFTGGTYATCSLEPSPEKKRQSSANRKDRTKLKLRHETSAKSNLISNYYSTEKPRRKHVLSQHSKLVSPSNQSWKGETSRSMQSRVYRHASGKSKSSKIQVISLDSESDFEDMPVIKVKGTDKQLVFGVSRSDTDFELVESQASDEQSQSILKSSGGKAMHGNTSIQDYSSTDDESACTVVEASSKNVFKKNDSQKRMQVSTDGPKYGSDIDDSGTSESDEPITLYKKHVFGKTKSQVRRRKTSEHSSEEISAREYHFNVEGQRSGYHRKAPHHNQQEQELAPGKANRNASRCPYIEAHKKVQEFASTDPSTDDDDDDDETIPTTTNKNSDQPVCNNKGGRGVHLHQQANSMVPPKRADNHDVLSTTTDDLGDSDGSFAGKASDLVIPETTSSSDIEMPLKGIKFMTSSAISLKKIKDNSISEVPSDPIASLAVLKQSQTLANQETLKIKKARLNVLHSDEELFDDVCHDSVEDVALSSNDETIDISSDIDGTMIHEEPKCSDCMMPSVVVEDVMKDPKWQGYLGKLYEVPKVDDTPCEQLDIDKNLDLDVENSCGTIAETQQFCALDRNIQGDECPKVPVNASHCDTYIDIEHWDSDESADWSPFGKTGQGNNEAMRNVFNEKPLGASSPIVTPNLKSFHLPQNPEKTLCVPSAVGQLSPVVQSVILGQSHPGPHHSTPAVCKNLQSVDQPPVSSPIVGVNDATLEDINQSILLLEEDDSFEFQDSQTIESRIGAGLICASEISVKKELDVIEPKQTDGPDSNIEATSGSVHRKPNSICEDDLNAVCKKAAYLSDTPLSKCLKDQESGIMPKHVHFMTDASSKSVIQTAPFTKDVHDQEKQQILQTDENKNSIADQTRTLLQDPSVSRMNLDVNDTKMHETRQLSEEEDLFEYSQWVEEGDGVEDDVIMASAAAVESVVAATKSCSVSHQAQNDSNVKTAVPSSVASPSTNVCVVEDDSELSGEAEWQVTLPLEVAEQTEVPFIPDLEVNSDLSREEKGQVKLPLEVAGQTEVRFNPDLEVNSDLSREEKGQVKLPLEVTGQNQVRFNPDLEFTQLSPLSKAEVDEYQDVTFDDSFTFFSQVDSEVIVLSDDSDAEPDKLEVKKEPQDSVQDIFEFDEHDSDIFLVDDDDWDLEDIKITVKKEDKSWWDNDTFSQMPQSDSDPDVVEDAVYPSSPVFVGKSEVTVKTETDDMLDGDKLRAADTAAESAEEVDGVKIVCKVDESAIVKGKVPNSFENCSKSSKLEDIKSMDIISHKLPKDIEIVDDDFYIAAEPCKKTHLPHSKNTTIRTVHALSEETEEDSASHKKLIKSTYFEDESTDEDEPMALEYDFESLSEDELPTLLSMHYNETGKSTKRKRSRSKDEHSKEPFSSFTKSKRTKSESKKGDSFQSIGKPDKASCAEVMKRSLPAGGETKSKSARQAIEIEHQRHVGGKSNHRELSKFMGGNGDDEESAEWLSKAIAGSSTLKSTEAKPRGSTGKNRHVSFKGTTGKTKPSGRITGTSGGTGTSSVKDSISEARRKMMERNKIAAGEKEKEKLQALNKDKPLIFCTDYKEQEKKVAADIENANKMARDKASDDGKRRSSVDTSKSASKQSRSDDSRSSKSHSSRSKSSRRDSDKSRESKSHKSQSSKRDRSSEGNKKHDGSKSRRSKFEDGKSSRSGKKDSRSDKSRSHKSDHDRKQSSKERHSSKSHKVTSKENKDQEKKNKDATSYTTKSKPPSGDKNSHQATPTKDNVSLAKSGKNKERNVFEQLSATSSHATADPTPSRTRMPDRTIGGKGESSTKAQKPEKQDKSDSSHKNVLIDVNSVKSKSASASEKKTNISNALSKKVDLTNPAFNLVDQIKAGSCFKKPTAVAQARPSVRDGGVDITSGATVTEEDFLASVLRWNSRWLEEQRKDEKRPPPILNAHCLPGVQTGAKAQLYPLLESGYSSFHEYLSIMLPLLLYETWAGLYSSWCQLRAPFDFQLLQTTKWTDDRQNAKIHAAQFQGLFRPAEVSNPASPKEGNLLVLSISAVRDGQKIKSQMLGYISKLMWVPARGHRQMHSKLAKDEKLKEPWCKLCVATIKLFKRGQGEPEGSWVSGRLLGSIITGMRQLTAILALRESRLVCDILRPTNVPRVFCITSPSETRPADLQSLNPSQLDVVLSVAHAVRQPFVEPRICLIQGPPGTGKSHTIIALIRTILKQKSVDGQRSRILLTAPSNAAVDELMKRLIKDRQQSGLGPRGPKFVRVGRTVHPKLQEFSLDELVQAEAEAEACKFLPESVRRELMTMRRRLRTINEDLQTITDRQEKSNKFDEKGKLLKKIKLLCGENKPHPASRELSFADRVKLRKKVLFNMDVICSTLNTSGCRWLLEILGSSQNGQPFFSCCIVDEACQTTEADCLIPLQYNCTKLVLVGDPKQLPATIISSKAEEFSFGQSLFERFFNFFSDMAIPPVKLLSVQYRMHPEICHFPNHHMYQGRLSTDKSVLKRSQCFPFRPYALFDLHYSQEEQLGKAVQNMGEVHFICALCQYLMHRGAMAEAIGIISPYKAQKFALIRVLQSKNLDIEIDTVDSFQGREKDIIIFTCVRANTDKGIGFLKERRRMNVALTRARYALYVVGHLATLKGNHDFKSLVYDAEKRKHIVPVRSESEKAFDKWLYFKQQRPLQHR